MGTSQLQYTTARAAARPWEINPHGFSTFGELFWEALSPLRCIAGWRCLACSPVQEKGGRGSATCAVWLQAAPWVGVGGEGVRAACLSEYVSLGEGVRAECLCGGAGGRGCTCGVPLCWCGCARVYVWRVSLNVRVGEGVRVACLCVGLGGRGSTCGVSLCWRGWARVYVRRVSLNGCG